MNISDTSITLTDIRFFAYHGVLDSERRLGNDYLITLTLTFPAEHAMHSDDVKDTINYAEVYEVLRHEMSIPSRLLEHAVKRILKALGEAFPTLRSCHCLLTKVAPPISSFQSAGVSFGATATYPKD